MPNIYKYAPAFISAIYLVGCASSRSVVEKSAFQGDFSKYTNVAVALEDNPKIEARHKPEILLKKLKRFLAKTNMFRDVTTTPNDPATELVIKVRVNELDAAGALGALIMASTTNSEVKVLCNFIEKKTDRTLATIEAMGNSKYMGRASIGGIGVTDTSSYTGRAYENAVETIVKYIEDHHSGMKKK